MKYKTEIMEMARIACATVPDDLQDQMDIPDDFFIEIRDYINWKMSEPSLKENRGWAKEDEV
tara:strand:- start:308 stop:493 length:186 start_codon:yes stop_codon:yes gene_type:complete